MKITMDEQGVIRPEGALKKRQYINARGENTGREVDVCAECGEEVEIKVIVGILHECSPDRVKTHYD